MNNPATPLGESSPDPTPLGATSEQTPEERSSVRRENAAFEISMATGRSPEEVAVSLENGDRTPVEEAKSSVPDAVQAQLVASTEEQQDPEQAANDLQGAFEKQQEFTSTDGFYLEGALTVGDPNYSPALARTLRNQQIGMEVLEERFKDAQEKGFLGKSVDFIDRFIFRYMPIGLYEDVTRESESAGLELAQAAANMEPDEFRSYMEDYANGKAEEGFFKDENYFAFLDAVGEAQNSGFDPMGGINQIIGIAEAVPLAKAALSAGKLATRVGGIRGPRAAAEAVEQAGENALKDPEIQSEALPRQFDLGSNESIKPTLGRVARMAEENALIQDIQSLYKSGTFGRVATQEQVSAAAERVRQNVEGISSRTIADENISLVDPVGLGDYTSTFRMGKAKDGAPYADKGNATKYANQLQNRGLAARVVEVDPDDASKGFYVEVAERLDLSRVADPLDLNVHQNIFNRGVGRVFGSTLQVDDDYLNTLANMGEGGSGAIRDAVQPYLDTLEKLPLESKTTIGQIFKDLRDGDDAFIRDGYSEVEFKTKFRQYHPSGKAPTEQDIDAFYAAKTISDSAYILQANRVANRYVARGYKSLEVESGVFVPGKTTNDIGDNVAILSGETGRIISKADLADNAVVWKLDRELEGGVDLVTSPRNVGTIRYEDVLGYNAGGRRVNPDAKYFVTLGDRAILTTFTDKLARSARAQIDNIVKAARRSSDNLDQLTDELDDVIKKNNDWNPSIENTADFVALAQRKGWRLNDEVDFKARDDVLKETDSELFAGLSMDDYVKSTQRRYDDVLMEYGGNETFNYNPIQSMVQQLSDTAKEYSFRAYTQTSKVSWLKAAGKGQALKDNPNVEAVWRSVDPSDLKGEKGRRLRELKAIIDRRDQVQSGISAAMSDFGASTAEYVFGKTKGKVKVNLDEMNVPGSLLNLGFRSAFGFLNLSQFFLQASHSFVIASISPRHGSKAAGLVIPLRLAMASGDPKGLQRLAKLSGISDSDMDELVKYINTSGRRNIENDAIEKGTGPGWGISSWEGQDLRPTTVRKTLHQTSRVVKAADRVGLAAFNEGEKLSRWTGMITAFLEYKAKYRGASAMSDAGRQWITRREQNLSFNMTTTSRGAWQSGLMKVPTQWLSYSMRAVENVVLGRGFTKGERARMTLMMGSMGGATGAFLGGAADEVSEKYGLDPSGPAAVGLRYGLVDAVLTYGLQGLTGEELRTAFGTRIAPLTAFTDLHRKVTEESAVTALGGPSGEIVGGGASALFSSLKALVTGQQMTAWEDVQRVLRTPSGVDNIWKATTIANEGVYRSKSGTEIPLEFSDWEAAMQAVGLTNYRVADFYGERTSAFRENRKMRSFRKEIENDFQAALRMWDKDEVRAREFMGEIFARIEAAPFSPQDKNSLRRSLHSDSTGIIADLTIRQIQKANPGGTARIESWEVED